MARIHDIRLKISDEARAYLKWRLEVDKVDMNELAADILHDYALHEFRKVRLANEVCESEGLASVVRPNSGPRKA